MRRLRVSPFAVVALVAGLAGSLLLLALLEAAVLRPIPGVAEPERLIALASPSAVSYPALHDLDQYARLQTGLRGVAGYSQRWFAVSAGESPEERRSGTVVAGDYFALLGAQARIGRLLGPIDDRPDAPPVVDLDHAFWRSAFAGRTDTLGAKLRLNGAAFEIVGVAAPDFRGLARERHPDFWVSAHAWMAHAPTNFGRLSLDGRGWGWLRAFGRLAPGAPFARAQELLARAWQEQSLLYPSESGRDFAHFRVVPATLQASGLDSTRAALTISTAIATGVGLLLLLSTASAAQIFLARAEARRQELATRLALGAGARRLALLLLAEPLATAALSVASALALASWMLARLSHQSLPGGIRLEQLGLTIDARVATFGALLALGAGLAAGLIPARRLLGRDLASALGSSRTVSAGGRRTFSVVQVAVSLVLVTATALCVRALGRAGAVETGYRGDRLGFVQLDAGLARLTPETAAARYAAALAAARELGGVESATLLGNPPLDNGEDVESFILAGYSPVGDEQLQAEVAILGPDALSLLGIELVAGREITPADRSDSEPVIVASEAFVRRYLAGREPLGAIVTVDRPRRIVGVARDVRAHGPGELQGPTLYRPWTQLTGAGGGPIVLAFRARVGAGDQLAEVARATAAAAPGVPVETIGTFDDLVASALAPQRFGAGLFGLFSTVAMLLAAVGLFGLVAHAAVARTRELGLRAALGAVPAQLVRHLFSGALRPLALGLAVGFALCLPLLFAARGLFVGLERLDAGALLIAALVLASTTATASLLPALRAARLDPHRALREE
jgi:predicted permease